MFKIGTNYIGNTKETYIIAEAGINHNGDLEIGKKLIEKAAECKANAIKFQTIIPEELFSDVVSPELFELVKNWVFDKKQHFELIKHAKKHKIHFISTPMGEKTAELLVKLKVSPIKIASGDLTHHELLKFVAKKKTPTIISTGLSKISEIASAVEIMSEKNCPFALLHCNSSYPTPPEDANLSTIPVLKKLFDVPIGYSDHTTEIETCIAAVALGATIIEKHFTLDKNMEGPDQKLSADPKEFSKLVKNIRITEKSLGKPRTKATRSEEKFISKMRKGVGASTNIPAGTKIKKSMLAVFRPANGISPDMIDHLIGMTVKRNIDKGTHITWDSF